MSDDATDLEDRVAELEATVRGLTEELVDAGERIRALEAELDQPPSTDALRQARDQSAIEPADDQPADETDADDTEDDTTTDDTDDSGLDDIIVA
ncbi:DUF7518 family protein [Halobacterium sp. MBLA0001]|uniref:DUF7518 family protein n=1 Tax=Halobacterium TaxID=2239 RepID=UPI002554CD83|nr:hypothetical protein [Halobacterium salinarum]MDL0127018.1 hypothetical protein [Halobacterium salinarum]MDL0135584.1 hypothetical protein [Halobacterium salinarum]